jgi:hypothetical protein
MISYPSRSHHVAALYDACKVIVDVYNNTDMLDVYEENKLCDAYQLQLTCREVMNLVSEGYIK